MSIYKSSTKSIKKAEKKKQKRSNEKTHKLLLEIIMPSLKSVLMD